MNKTAIKNFSIWARKKLLDDISYLAMLKGVSAEGIAVPLPQSTGDLQFFDIGTRDYAQVAGKEIAQRNALVERIRSRERGSDYRSAFDAVMEEIAYTWFNRLVAIRFMEVNDYLPSRVRVLSSENPTKNEPDMVTNPFDTDMEFTEAEQETILRLKDESRLDELFRILFRKQCNKLNEILPEMFERVNDYTELLLNISFTDRDGIVWHLVHDIEEEDFDVERGGQVEIIGWLYQYYNTELNEQVYDGNMSKSRISKELLPAATTIYTPDWAVQYMVQNSLGRLWLEGHPNDDLKASWKYYLDEAEQEPDVQAQLDEIRKGYRVLNPEDIRVVDPCMGSGHILVRIFGVLMQIYEFQGYTQRDAAQSILRYNLYGLDIDQRAAQLAYFAVMMKARQYDRRIFSRGIQPHVFAIVESNDLSEQWVVGNDQMQTLFDCMKDAKEYGSILTVPQLDFDSLRQFAKERTEQIGQLSMENVVLQGQLPQILALLDVAETLAQKYEVVITNPPYLGSSRFSPKLDKYVKENYAEEKSDLSMVMLKKAMRDFSRRDGFISFITTSSWMFLSSFEKTRNYMFSNLAISSLVDYGTELFEGKVGHNPIASWVNRNTRLDYKLTAIRLVDYCYSRRDEKEPEFFEARNRYTAWQSNFAKIPGSPVAYWASKTFIGLFELPQIIHNGRACVGMRTGDNNRFMRFWHEISFHNFLSSAVSADDAKSKSAKWIPYNKGGDYRKWYGNQQFVVNWENDGYEIKENTRRVYPELGDDLGWKISNESLYFKEHICWTDLTSKGLSFRYFPFGFIFDCSANVFFPSNNFLTLFAYLNSKVVDCIASFLNPTMHFKINNFNALPCDNSVLTENEEELVKQNIAISKTDWDDVETSWNFIHHPLVGSFSTVSAAFAGWQDVCTARFTQLKANEEELNRIFIDIYGLQDELTPEVEDKDVTVRKADLGRDIRSLLSYAVGCMFGRYSLDVDGLAYAGGEWDSSKYVTFIPDKDNAIPITDEAYFEDDIVGLFCKWLKTVYGADTLEENLDFIAKALGNKGDTSRDVIRNYFLNDFIKDHIRIYQKRPIYWLFDSGKKSGFKCLVYMHRWNADTAGNVRVEYLHKLQHVYEREIQQMQETIEEDRDRWQVARAMKRRDKFQKQLKETQEYDAKLGHIALCRIDIDLDDGVKVNYEKVQTGRDGKKMQILTKI
ncbi:MAG: BREX-1 system adenine-specific DNA-methyltransferase PglX [Lachnospiraceae bacterium]|nr:BREX-1 system adenine-specific DNA-methyltransferase PglX [Lachnospiraceae bacterium]